MNENMKIYFIIKTALILLYTYCRYVYKWPDPFGCQVLKICKAPD